MASGNIIHVSSDINYCHTCSTYFASSGSPLINSSLKVIGIHKSSGDNENYATKISVAIYAIFTSYKRKYNNEIRDTWYWTDDKNLKDCEKTKLKNLKWKIIIPQEKQIDMKNHSLMSIHRILINWLRLSQFMYL